MIQLFPDHGSIRFQKVRDAGGVLNATLALVQRNVREVMFGLVAIVSPLAIVAAIASAVFAQEFGTTFNPIEPDPSDPFAVFGPAYWVVLFASMFGIVVAQSAAAGYVRLYRQGEAGVISPGLLWDETKGLILPTLGYTLATFVASMVLGIAAVLVGVLVGSVVSAVVGGVLGFVALVGLGVWLIPFASIAWASRMIESSSLADAFPRAFHLVRGSWWYVFLTILLVGIVTVVVLIILSIPLQLVSAALGISDARSDASVAVLAAAGIPVQILSYVAYAIPTFAIFFVHGRLAEELDGSSLDEELDFLEAGVDASPASSWTDAPSRAPGTSASDEPDDAALPRISRGTAPSPLPTISRDDPAEPRADAPPPDTPPPDDEPPSSGGFRGGGFGT